MTNFLEAMATLFGFLFQQLGACATFFISNVMGQIIFGVVLFSIVVSAFVKIIFKR